MAGTQKKDREWIQKAKSPISITLDRYGHLMPGSEAEAAGLLETYLAAQRGRAEDAAGAMEVEPQPVSDAVPRLR